MPVVSLVVTLTKQKRARTRARSVTPSVALHSSSTLAGESNFIVAPWNTNTVCKRLCSLSRCAPTSPRLPVFIKGHDYRCKLSQSVLQKKCTTPSKRDCRRFGPLIHVPRKKVSLSTFWNLVLINDVSLCVCFGVFSLNSSSSSVENDVEQLLRMKPLL